MTELSSQAYTHGLARVHHAPPWMRVLIIDPESGKEVAVGKSGIVRLFDLANVGSVIGIQTADMAIRRKEGFELLGRDPAAVPRGCSRRTDEMLNGRAASASIFVTRGDPAPAMPAGSLPVTCDRAQMLANVAKGFPELGSVTMRGLLTLVRSELGHEAALDRFVTHGRFLTRALAPRKILHVLSGNTPAAALQTLLRGLLLGSHNFCKLPAGGIPEVLRFRSKLPAALARRIEFSPELTSAWLEAADAAVLFGRDETVAAVRALLKPEIPVVSHGHRLSLAVIFDDPDFRSPRGAARDVSIFDQQGCLSPQVVFIRENKSLTLESYAQRLAREMGRFEKSIPRRRLTLSESNSIFSLREEIQFRSANRERIGVLNSADTAWTVVTDRTAGLPATPLNRVIHLKPLPRSLGELIAPHRAHLSTCGIWPMNDVSRDIVSALGFTRICPVGKMQSPPLEWHHDGQRVLAPLVRWIDCEG